MITMRFLYFTIIFIFLISCSDNSEIPISENVLIVKSLNNCDLVSDTCTYVKVNYPVITLQSNKPVEKKINTFINSQLVLPMFGEAKFANIDELIEQFFSEYTEMNKEFPSYKIPWVLEKNVEIKFANSVVTSIVSMTYSFLGGSHPNTVYNFQSISNRDGNVIELTEFIESSKIDSFKQIMLNRFREANEIPKDSSLASAGFWFDNGFFLPANFIITETGLKFFYNLYEIAPYSMGTTELNVPLEIVQPFLKKNINYWE